MNNEYWAIFNPEGEFDFTAPVGKYKSTCIICSEMRSGLRWSELEAKGYTCRKVRIEEAKSGVYD